MLSGLPWDEKVKTTLGAIYVAVAVIVLLCAQAGIEGRADRRRSNCETGRLIQATGLTKKLRQPGCGWSDGFSGTCAFAMRDSLCEP